MATSRLDEWLLRWPQRRQAIEQLVAMWTQADRDIWNHAIEAAAVHLEEQAREYTMDVDVCLRAQAGEIRKLKRKAAE